MIMEKMPFHESLTTMSAVDAPLVSSDWQRGLPMLSSTTVTLRELQLSDAPSLLAMLTTEEVARFISPPPTTVEGFERFIQWTHAERQAGRYVCFAVVPKGMTHAIGLFQVRQLEADFRVAEWGFAMGSAFWGTGIFVESARLVLDYTFEAIGVHRLEARAAVQNGRGNGALRKLGARPEAVLRKSFIRDGHAIDQQLWSILAEDWTMLTMATVLRLH
jgi:[ribosomal protein S5]-alanine N-acetyltransferase